MAPVRKNTALWQCVVLTCETDCRKSTAHRIPKNADKASLWVKSLGNPELFSLGVAELNKYRVCSKHFTSADYLSQTRKPTLKEGVLPSLRLPISAGVCTGNFSESGRPESTDNFATVLNTVPDQSVPTEHGKSKKRPYEDASPIVSLKRMRPLGSHVSGLSRRERMQLRNNGVSPRGRRFSMEEKLLALSWMKASGRGYRLLQSQFQLPCTRTLTSLLNKSPLDSGINKKVIRALKKKVAAFKDPQDKFVTLMWDEIKLDANLQYDLKLDKIIGFEDWGNRRTSTLADHALVFMVRGIKNNWKMPLSFTFCASQTKTAQLLQLIKSHIKILQQVSLSTVVTVCDQGASNVTAIRQLQKESRTFNLKNSLPNDPTVISVYGIEIIPIYDSPHLLKCLRNNMLTKHLEFKPWGLPDNQRHFADWSHLELLHNLDLYAETDNRRLWRLTKGHVDRRSIKKMRVKYAAQVFSKTCATFLAMAARYGSKTSAGATMPKEAADTSKVLGFFNDLFDSVNGSSRTGERTTNLRSAVTLTSAHLGFWGDARKRLSSMRFVRTDNCSPVKLVPCLENWNRTLDGFQHIRKRLLVKEKFKSFAPRNINQDSLENFFGSIRSHGWRNVNPSCKQFTAAYQSLVVNSISFPHSRGANCEDDQGDMLRDLSCMMENQSAEPDTDSLMDDLPLPVENCNEQSVSDSIFYEPMHSHAANVVAQKLLKFVNNCVECEKCMLAENYDSFSNNEYRLIIPGSQNLRNVNSVFVTSLENCNQLLKSILPSYCFRRKLISTLHSKICENETVNWSTCTKHASVVKSKFVQILILSQVHAFCGNVNRILKGKYDSSLYCQNFVFRQARTYRFKHSQHTKNL